MGIWKLAAILVGLALALGSDRLAAAAPPAWQADWGTDTCSLVRIPDDPKAMVLMLRHTPGTDFMFVRLVHRQWAKAKSGDAADLLLSLDPGGAVAAEASFTPYFFTEGPSLSFRVDGRAFPERVAAAETLSVTQSGRLIASFSLPQAAAAVKSLRNCERTALTGWGIDADAWYKLRSSPTPKRPLASLVQDNDYPVDAIRQNASGMVVARLSIDSTGKLVSCDTLVTSGHPSLDRKTCEVFLKRAQFEPAIDAEARAVAAPYIATLGWYLPR